MKTFGFTRIAESIDTTHRSNLGTYTTNFRNKGYKLESRVHDDKRERIQLRKGILYQGKNSKVFLNMKELSDNNPPKDHVVRKGSDGEY